MNIAANKAFESEGLYQLCSPRYVWREVNYTLFLYDTLEDIYLPAQAFWEMMSA